MLVWRVLYECLVRGTESNELIVTTFTRKAATELQVRLVERCDALLEKAQSSGLIVDDPRVHDLRVGTIHSLCDSLLAEFDIRYMEAGTRLIDETEARLRIARTYRYSLGKDTVDRLLSREPLVALFRSGWDDGSWPRLLMDRVEFLQSVLAHHSETWIPRCDASGLKNGVEQVHRIRGLTKDLVELHKKWLEYLDDQHIVDFTTLQYRFFERQSALSGKFAHVFVDEFQDTNPIQFAIHTRWLTSPATRLTVVGDDDQSLYRFRGSDFECFVQLEPFCSGNGIPFRREKLEQNWRSSRAIVAFSQAYKGKSVLAKVSMPKRITAGDGVSLGERVRLLRGDWASVSSKVAAEVSRVPQAQSVAVLMFSTSEKGGKKGPTPASELKVAIESAGRRVYNPRSKTAAIRGTPVAELFGLLSYLVDPVIKAPVGKKGRAVEVWASCNEPAKAAASRVCAPSLYVSPAHAGFQKRFRKIGRGDLDQGISDEYRELLAYVDAMRVRLADDQAKGEKIRLTLAGLVARLLTFPRFRESGFTVDLFRQAMFTGLLEANIAPTRLTKGSLDMPIIVLRKDRKLVWADEIWRFLNYFGAFLEDSPLDDEEVEAFEDGAVAMMTFHQAKGLEFDHVYVAATGREVNPHSVLRTMLFSGRPIRYKVTGGQVKTRDRSILPLAEADRAREVYVAMTRAKSRLTILHAPDDDRRLMALDPAIETLMRSARQVKSKASGGVETWEFKHG